MISASKTRFVTLSNEKGESDDPRQQSIAVLQRNSFFGGGRWGQRNIFCEGVGVADGILYFTVSRMPGSSFNVLAALSDQFSNLCRVHLILLTQKFDCLVTWLGVKAQWRHALVGVGAAPVLVWHFGSFPALKLGQLTFCFPPFETHVYRLNDYILNARTS